MWYLSKIEAAFGADRAADPATIPSAAWQDITTDVARWSSKRGRAYELAEIQAGSATLVLHNDTNRYSPGYNPASDNLLPIDVATCGSTRAGVMPSGIYMNSPSNTTLAIAASSGGSNTPFSYQVSITGSTGTAPLIQTRGSADSTAGPFDISKCVRVDPSTEYTFRLRHYLVSGTATAVRTVIYWLDSNGTVLSSANSSTFTPTGSIAARVNTATSHASARYAAIGIEYTTAPAAAQVVQYSDLAMKVGASANWSDPLNYPNVRPGVPVRITVQDSGAVYRNVFYGFTGHWRENINDSLVEVDLDDTMEYLAERGLTTASEEQTEEVAPLVSIPFSDASDVRDTKYTVKASDGTELSRLVGSAGAAADLSEYTFGEPGPQDGLRAIYMDPESQSVGYAPRVSIPSDKQLIPDGGETTPDFWVGGWFRIKKKEHGARRHIMFATVNQSSKNMQFQIHMNSDGTVAVHMTDQPVGLLYESVTTTNTYWDGEWHYVYAQFAKPGGTYTTTLTVDWDNNGNGELVSSTEGAALVAEDGPFYAYLGGSVNGAVEYFMRGWLSQWAWGRPSLTAAQRASMYKVSAPEGAFTGESETDRIGRLLDYVGWPAAMRSLDSSVTTLVGGYPYDTNALEAIKEVAASTGGTVYIAKDGKVSYANRRRRYNPTTALTCSVAGATMPEDDFTPAIDASYVYNRVRIVRPERPTVEVNDADSQGKYGVRTLDLDMPLLSDEDAYQAASWFLAIYKEPVARVGTITLNAAASNTSTLWDYLVNLDLFDNEVIDVGTTTLGGRKFFVESIELSYEQDTLTFSGTLELSPAERYLNICKLDDGTSGVLDSCVLGW